MESIVPAGTDKQDQTGRLEELAASEESLAAATAGTDHAYWHARTAKLIRRALAGARPADGGGA